VIEVTLFSKPECCLCDTAKMMLNRLKTLYSFQCKEIDISQDFQLLQKYGNSIPVVLVNGQEICQGRIDERQIKSALDKFKATGIESYV